jgi:hypothetical protein
MNRDEDDRYIMGEPMGIYSILAIVVIIFGAIVVIFSI